MIKRIWRYSHLALAVSSFLLLTLASLSGIVLAFEPVIQKAKEYKIDGFDTLTLAQSIPVVKEKLHGVQELHVDDNGFVTAKYSDKDGNDRTAYINPITGETIGTPQKQAPLFAWMTTLHRSLFLHETGRAIVAVAAFLLILIAVSGIALIIQRQNGIRHFFATIEKTNSAQYYHTVFGRLSLVFILAIALSGSYLSLSRFVIKPQKINAKVNVDNIKEEPEKKLADITAFQKIRLSEVETIQFPFSDFLEDYFTLKLKDRELCINQITGDVLAQQQYPQSYTLAAFSLRWHAGRSNAVWAIVLAITSGYILFFIYSGFIITWNRIRNKPKNRFTAEESRIIILAGSENGSTYNFANAIYQQLIKHGEKVFLTDLNQYALYPKAEHLIIMTSTYGEGEAPANATKFKELLLQHPQQQTVSFSVVGFGSRSYVNFCGFANEIDQLLRQQTWAKPLMNLITVNDRSPQDFSAWLTGWTKQTGLPLILPRQLLQSNQKDLQSLRVIDKTQPDEDHVFLIRLKTNRMSAIKSGDLLAVYPKNDHRERLYSIGKVDGNIQLSVKWYEQGLGSHFLQALQTGDVCKARVIKNEHFHFPKKMSQVIMISNGTGIAPFLGMVDENKLKLACILYCGFRTQTSFSLYQSLLSGAITDGKLNQYKLALSREGEKQYVSQLIQKDEDFISEVLSNNGVIMICGSLSMQKDVMAVLEIICQKRNENLLTYQSNGQILTDCY